MSWSRGTTIELTCLGSREARGVDGAHEETYPHAGPSELLMTSVPEHPRRHAGSGGIDTVRDCMRAGDPEAFLPSAANCVADQLPEDV